MKNIFENVINKGGYNLTALLNRIDKYHIEGKLSDAERETLYNKARGNVVNQYDYSAEIERIWAAIRALQDANTEDSGNTEVIENEYPQYVQPTGAHDAYQVGDKITFNSNKYICTMANCVYSPSVLPSAWELAEVE